MRKKYTISLILVLCAILLCIFIDVQYQIYLNELETNGAVTMASEDLSINYLDGNKVRVNENSKTIQFSIINHSKESLYFYVRFFDLVGNTEGSSYVLTSSKETFSTIKNTFSNNSILSRQEILPGETQRYTMKIENPNNTNFSFQLDIDKEKMDDSFRTTLLSNNTVLDGNVISYQNSPLESGLFQKTEQTGTTYFFRGNVTNNYVSFAGLLWRIVKINEDGSVKLILNNTTENMLKMSDTEVESFSFDSSSLYQKLEEWYNTYLIDYDEWIVSTNYCYDDNILTDENNQIEYLSNVRLSSEYLPTNICGGTTISKKIALLTADEAMFAGANSNASKDYYLYLDSLQASWWTMTPNKKENNTIFYFGVNSNGELEKDYPHSSNLFARPVITLAKRVKMLGNGTKDSPYLLENV